MNNSQHFGGEAGAPGFPIATALADYPAAHSMDTEWFAVDAEGNVGLFNTGEDGALPKAASCARFGVSEFAVCRLACFAEAYAAELRNEEDEVCLDDLRPDALLDEVEQRTRFENRGILRKRCHMVLLAEDEGHLSPSDRTRFVRVGSLLLSRQPVLGVTIRRIAKLGVRVFDLFTVLYYELDESTVFRFSRDHGEDPGFYRRDFSPVHPIKAGDLPSNAAAKLRFPVNFKNATELHLGDFMKNEDADYWIQEWALRWKDVKPEFK